MRSNKYYAVPEEGESLEHRSHKYIKKIRKNGRWVYYYKEKAKEAGKLFDAKAQEEGNKLMLNWSHANVTDSENKFNKLAEDLTGEKGFSAGVSAALYAQNHPDDPKTKKMDNAYANLKSARNDVDHFSKKYVNQHSDYVKAVEAKREVDKMDKYDLEKLSPSVRSKINKEKAKREMDKKIESGKAMNAAKRKKVGSSKISAGKKKNVLQKGADLVKKILKHSGMEDGEYLEHIAKGGQKKKHKYIARKLVNGKWQYTYKDLTPRGWKESNRESEALSRKYDLYGLALDDKGGELLDKAGEYRKQYKDLWNQWTGDSAQTMIKNSKEKGAKATISNPGYWDIQKKMSSAYGNKLNAEKRKAAGSSSLGNDKVLSDQTQNRLKAQSNAKKLATSNSLEKAKQEQAGYKKAASGLYETVNKKNVGAANKYSKKAKEASNKVANAGMTINAAKRKASGSGSLANQKQSTKKKKTSKISKTLKKGQSIINKLLGR